MGATVFGAFAVFLAVGGALGARDGVGKHGVGFSHSRSSVAAADGRTIPAVTHPGRGRRRMRPTSVRTAMGGDGTRSRYRSDARHGVEGHACGQDVGQSRTRRVAGFLSRGGHAPTRKRRACSKLIWIARLTPIGAPMPSASVQPSQRGLRHVARGGVEDSRSSGGRHRRPNSSSTSPADDAKSSRSRRHRITSPQKSTKRRM